MKVILNTSDPTVISFATALLRAEGIEPFVLDVNMSVLEGSIGIFPKRLAVADKQCFLAKKTLEANGIEIL